MRFLEQATRFTVEKLIAHTGADIRIHDANRVPAGPCLFAVNHFTRLESIFLPGILFSITKKNTLFVMSGQVEEEGYNRLLKAMGTETVRLDGRKERAIQSLLTGTESCLLFPEGRMVRDKKIVERRKYAAFKLGISSCAETGIAELALHAARVRRQIVQLRAEKQYTKLDEMLSRYGLTAADDLDALVHAQTHIVPVNVTYFPIRARNNAISRFAKKFIDKTNIQLAEDFQLEGTMLIDKTNIDINFGRPFIAENYLDAGGVIKKTLFRIFPKYRYKQNIVKLTRTIMQSIYQMVTINHDHLCSFLLMHDMRTRIKESVFKKELYLAVNRVASGGALSMHTSLLLEQKNLLTDESHRHYDNFIEAAKYENLISIENGYIVKNQQRFSRIYQITRIRKDNVLELLGNEIEPLKKIIRYLRLLIHLPLFLFRGKLRINVLLDEDALFEQDYTAFYREGESKPKHIGRPFLLKKTFSKKAVLLIHGYMAAPAEMRAMAEYLNKRGYIVYAVRMRGHGTSPYDLATRSWEEWYDSASRGYALLSSMVSHVAVVGFSTGAGVALLQGIRKKGKYRAVVSINAPLKLVEKGSGIARDNQFY